MSQTLIAAYHGSPFNPGQPVPCADDPDLFEPPNKGAQRRHPTPQQAQAIYICQTCPVLEQCRRWALQNALDDETILGGMTGHQRRQHGTHTPPGRPCPKGHPVVNMYQRADGHRVCRQCQRERERRNRERRGQTRRYEGMRP